MHSSRMRTGRSLTVCCSVLPGGGSPWSGGGCVCLVPGVGFSLVRGCAWSWGGFSLVLGGVPGPGRGFSLIRGGAWSQGGSPWSGGVFSGEPPPVNRITDTCKNITLATTSLRPVTRYMGLCTVRYR